MNYVKRHKALCSRCGYVEDSRESGTFIDKFFLPSMCAGCGSDMPSKYSYDHEIYDDQPHWQHVIEKRAYVPPVRTRNPLTWLQIGHWETIETTTFKA